MSPVLSIKELYRLYKADCLTNNKTYVSEYIYRQIFRFYAPPKKVSVVYVLFFTNYIYHYLYIIYSSPEEKHILKEDYEIHIQNKNNKGNDTESVRICPVVTVSLSPKAFKSCIKIPVYTT